MGESWTWTYADADGRPLEGGSLTAVAFPTQADAETWFGEVWPDLADAGVASVTLHRDGDVVYGPMPLSPA